MRPCEGISRPAARHIAVDEGGQVASRRRDLVGGCADAREDGYHLLEAHGFISGEVERAVQIVDSGDVAVGNCPVRSRSVVHAAGRALDARRVHGGLGVVGRVLVGAGVAPENRGELRARQRVAYAEKPCLLAVGVARDKALCRNKRDRIAVPIRVIHVGEGDLRGVGCGHIVGNLVGRVNRTVGRAHPKPCVPLLLKGLR